MPNVCFYYPLLDNSLEFTLKHLKYLHYNDTPPLTSSRSTLLPYPPSFVSSFVFSLKSAKNNLWCPYVLECEALLLGWPP